MKQRRKTVLSPQVINEPTCSRRAFLETVGAASLALGREPTSTDGASENPEQLLEDELDEHSRAIHQKSIVIVMHDHRPIAPDVPLMLAGGVTVKVYQIGVDVQIGAGFRTAPPPPEGWAARARAALAEARETIDANADRVLLAQTAQDIRRAKREGKIAILLGVEGGKLLEGSIDRLHEFYELGLRELQLRWAVANEIVEQDTLTEFGRSVVKECNRLGMIVDVTHIPERAFFQVMDLTEKPPIVSHGTARELGDRRVHAIAARRGVIGIHFYSSYLGPKPTVDRALDAIDEAVRRAGAESVGLGVDFFPSDGEWREFQIAQGTTDISWAIPDLSHLEQVTRGLVARNHSDAQIAGILGGNFLRVCQEVF